jgi:hypothetical protein
LKGYFEMAQRVQVLLVCDLHGDETPGSETVSFALDGSAYEIDVCDQHAGELRDAFAPYVGPARRAAGRVAGAASGRAGRRGARRGAAASSGFDPVAVRIWARQSGVKVSERGRIGADVLEQYAAAGH